MKQTKKAIRQLVVDALHQVLLTLDIADVSRKTKKAIQQASKELSNQVKDDLKKKSKKEAKLSIPAKKVGRKSA